MVHLTSCRTIWGNLTGYEFKRLINIRVKSYTLLPLDNSEFFYQIIDSFLPDMCCKPIFCSEIAQWDKSCSWLLETRKSCSRRSKVAVHKRDRPTSNSDSPCVDRTSILQEPSTLTMVASHNWKWKKVTIKIWVRWKEWGSDVIQIRTFTSELNCWQIL